MTHLFFRQESEIQTTWVMQPGSHFVQGPSAPAATAPATQLHGWGLGELSSRALVLPFWVQEPPHPSEAHAWDGKEAISPSSGGKPGLHVPPGSPGSRPSQAPGHGCQRWLFPWLKNLSTEETFFSAVAFPSLEPTPRPYLRWGHVQGTGRCNVSWNRVARLLFSQRRKREGGIQRSVSWFWEQALICSGPALNPGPGVSLTAGDGGSQQSPQPGREHALCQARDATKHKSWEKGDCEAPAVPAGQGTAMERQWGAGKSKPHTRLLEQRRLWIARQTVVKWRVFPKDTPLQWGGYLLFSHLSHVWPFATPWTIAHEAPRGWDFHRISHVHGISQVRTLERVLVSFSRGSSQPRDQTCVCYWAGRFFTTEPRAKKGRMLGVFKKLRVHKFPIVIPSK